MLDLTEESEFPAWDELMGKDPVHLTGEGYAKLASGVLRMAEGPDAVFSGGKRAHNGDDDRPAPTIVGRKAWIYTSTPPLPATDEEGDGAVGAAALVNVADPAEVPLEGG